MDELIAAIVADDEATVATLLLGDESCATREAVHEQYLEEIGHHLYAGDTPLHIAAAAYRVPMIRALLACGADASARNRRGAEPLHYAADGIPGSPNWNPAAQREAVEALLDAGADPNAIDKSGVTPLHRAVRTRSAAAVAALLDGGADPELTNKRGSTPLELATRMTGRAGGGSPEARAEQAEIIRLFELNAVAQ
ncbi:MAG TPA: ankyrin repeat domain-containing protein [Thermoleophilaceae bacterium]|jgi:ankyrin repeat protein